MPNWILIIALVAVMAGVVYVLVRGVIAMASGQDTSGQIQQSFMQKRVLLQGIAILIVVIILAAAGTRG